MPPKRWLRECYVVLSALLFIVNLSTGVVQVRFHRGPRVVCAVAVLHCHALERRARTACIACTIYRCLRMCSIRASCALHRVPQLLPGLTLLPEFCSRPRPASAT